MITNKAKDTMMRAGGSAGHEGSDIPPQRTEFAESSLVRKVEKILKHIGSFIDVHDCRVAAETFIALEEPVIAELEAAIVASQNTDLGKNAMHLLNACYMKSGIQDTVFNVRLVPQSVVLLPNLLYPRAVIVKTPLIDTPVIGGDGIIVNETQLNYFRTFNSGILINKGDIKDFLANDGLIITTKNIPFHGIRCMVVSFNSIVTVYELKNRISGMRTPRGAVLWLVQAGTSQYTLQNRNDEPEIRIIRPALDGKLCAYLSEMQVAVEGPAQGCTAYLRSQGGAEVIKNQILALWKEEHPYD